MQGTGHTHLGGAGMTQNQGNVLGDRPCVRQSRLYREHVGGNTMKELMGQDQLKWDTRRTEGAYQGGRVFDHNSANNHPAVTQQPAQLAERQAVNNNNAGGVKENGFRRGSGCANKQTYNILTGQ
jgi:hypothetical protein